MAERLTREQMAEKYPNQWIGIANVEYMDTEKKTMQSADVIYTDKTASELGMISLKERNIIPLYTTPDNTFQLGVIGG